MATATATFAIFGDGGVTWGATVTLTYDTSTMYCTAANYTVAGGTLTLYTTNSKGQTFTHSVSTSGSISLPSKYYKMFTLTTNSRGQTVFDLTSSDLSYQLTFN